MRILYFVFCCFFFFTALTAQKSTYSPKKNYLKNLAIDNQENHFLYKLHVSKTDIEAQLRSMKSDYVKDSLKILLIKLMNVEKLNDQNLLSMDVELNHAYYLTLLDEFRESEIDPDKYIYLENQCNLITIRKLKTKITISTAVFGIVLFSIFAWIIVIKGKSKSDITDMKKSISLTPQEVLVKDLIMENYSNKEIATELFISVSTVKSHISNLYKKYQVKNRAELRKT